MYIKYIKVSKAYRVAISGMPYFFAGLRDIRGTQKFWHISHSNKQFSTLFDIILGGCLVYSKIYLYTKKIK